MASERFQRLIGGLLDQVEEAVDQLDWEGVRSRSQTVLALDPGNADAINFLASAERALSGSAPTPTSQSTASILVTPPAAAPEHRTSFTNGRYQVKRFLGEGGKKKVYLAHDTMLDREVAFALIKTEGLNETGRSRIQREAQAMGRLGSHPHIVTVFDLGQEDGQTYMVTELMGGGDVEGLIDSAEDHRLPLEQAITIAKETCEGLEFAHSRGIIHRDLKPGNIWLSVDGTAKIGDFGLAVSLDRSRLTTEGMMVGTASYMPPEQAMGGEVSPRSDLYSLGAMLYEMVTGRPPFLGDDSVAIIGQHINIPPVGPTWHNSSCPRSLDALIMRLLAKDPSERPESATDVLAALDAIDLTISADQAAADVDEGHALDSLAGGVFVGRQREMGELKACLEDALSGRGRLVMLVGGPGIGKSRMAQELATYAGLRGAQVLWGRSYEEQGVPPYWPWIQAIRSYVRDRDPEQLRSEMGSGAADIAEVVYDVRERLPGLPSAPQLEPEQARFRLFDSIATFLKTASHRQALVLVLDDLHWADQPSLLLLQFVTRELGGARLLIIGTYRDMELFRQHPLAEALGELTRERLFQRVLLKGLTQEDVGRFIEMTSGRSPPRGLVEAVYTQTEGNPLFVTEVVRLLAQEGELDAEQMRERDSWIIHIPQGVREVIGRRLNRLTQRCNETLTVASIAGREFTLEQLGSLIEDVTQATLLEVLDEALSARVIEELPQAAGRYVFTHALIRETLVGELTTIRKVRLHARTAEALEILYGADAETHAAELAHHYAEAQTLLGTEKLVHFSLLAGNRALSGFAYEEGLAHFQKGLEAKHVSLESSETAGDADEANLLFGLGRAQSGTLPLYQLHLAVESLGRAARYYADVGDVDSAVAVAEHPLPPTAGRVTGASDLLALVLQMVSPGSLQEGRLLASHGRVLGMEHGEHQAALGALDRALEIARAAGDSSLEMRTLVNYAEVEAYHWRWQECSDKGLQAVKLVPLIDDPRAEMMAHYWTAATLIVLGDLDGADPHGKAALSAAERLRHHFYLSRTLFLNESLYRCRGDWSTAREIGDRGLAVSPNEVRLLGPRISLHYQLGEFTEGEIFLERLIETMRLAAPGPTFDYAFPALMIPQVAWITGDLSRLDVAEEAAETVLSSPSVTPQVAWPARAGLGLIAVQKGDAGAAREHYPYLKANGVSVAFGGVEDHRLLGLLAQTMGDLDQAEIDFDDALTFCRKGGFRPELAWTCFDYADFFLKRNNEGDRAKAITLLDESLAISSELGMRPLMERVLSRREILDA